jgi:TetR/AcrR family transcriptional regulator
VTGARTRLTGEQRRSEILAAAREVFATSGLGGARTSQIAEAAGVAESMLYKHFASKRELFEAAVTRPVAEFVQGVVDGADGLLDRDGPGSERFYRSFLATMTEVLPLLGVALFSDAADGRRFYNASIVPLFDRYEDTVRRSLGAVPGARVDAGFLSRAVIGIMFLLALDATYRDGTTGPGPRDQDSATGPQPRDQDGEAGPGPGPVGPLDRDALADEVRSFVAGALTGSGAADLLAVLTTLEAGGSAGVPTGESAGEEPPVPEMVTPAEWATYRASRREAAERAGRRERGLAEENATLRRVLADQALEIRHLRDRLGDP